MATTYQTKLALTGTLALLALGCHAPEEGDDHDLLAQGVPCEPSIDGGVEPTADGSVEESDAGQPDVPDAGPRPFFVEVTANGTGCPRGTWDSPISTDGSHFGMTFSAYEATVDDSTTLAFKDCNITVKLRSKDGLSYALSDFGYDGYVFLEEGVSGFQTSNYYFQGNPVPSADKEKRTNFTGPVDRSFTYVDVRETSDLIWSPCGLERNLQIVMRVGLQKPKNGSGKGSIRVNELHMPKLIWKKC